MRITFLNPVGVIGGAERVLLSALRSVREHRPDAELSLIQLGAGPLQTEADALGVAVEVVPLPEPLARAGDTLLRADRLRNLARLARSALVPAAELVGFIRDLQRALRRHSPDLIHSNGLKTHALAAFARPRGVPVIWQLHDFYSDRPVMARALNHLRAGVRASIAISNAVQCDAQEVLPGLPVTLIPNAIDTDHFTPGACAGALLDRLAGLPAAAAGTVRVGLVATYANWKGQDVFLDAMARLNGVRGYIIGGPIYSTAGSQFTRTELEQRAGANGLEGRIGFVPFQPDPVAVYRALDVVVHASTRREPFGLTIAEAMSCGKPVVVSAAGGAAELFTEGVDALGHPPGDTLALQQAIARLAGAATLRARIGAAARNTALLRFSLERYGRDLIALYDSVRLESPAVA